MYDTTHVWCNWSKYYHLWVRHINLFYSWSSQTHRIANIGIIAKFVFPHICSFLLYMHHMMLVNIKLDISGHKLITFQGYKLHWSGSFLMAQLKRSWQYWHSCIAQSLWKPLFVNTACTGPFDKHPEMSVTTLGGLKYWSHSSETGCANKCKGHKKFNCQTYLFRKQDRHCYIYDSPIIQIYSKKGRTTFTSPKCYKSK